MREFIKARRRGTLQNAFIRLTARRRGEIQKWYFGSVIDLLGGKALKKTTDQCGRDRFCWTPCQRPSSHGSILIAAAFALNGFPYVHSFIYL